MAHFKKIITCQQIHYDTENFILFVSSGSIKNCVWTRGHGNFKTSVKLPQSMKENPAQMDIDEPVNYDLLKNMGHSRPLFFNFVFSILLTVNVQYKFLPMTGFKPLTSGIECDRSTN